MFSAKRRFSIWLLLGLLVPSLLVAAEPSKSRKIERGECAGGNDRRAGRECRAIQGDRRRATVAQIVPNNAEVAHIFVTNLTKKPLAMQLPTVFAAKPVLAQFQVPGGQQQNQTTGTGFLQNGGQTPQILSGPDEVRLDKRSVWQQGRCVQHSAWQSGRCACQ